MPSLIFWGVQMTLISISLTLQFWHEQLRLRVTNTTDWFNVFFDKIILLTHYTWLLNKHIFIEGRGALYFYTLLSPGLHPVNATKLLSLPLSWLVHAHIKS